MPPKRRGSGFRTPEVRGTLGTLLRSAIEQASGVRGIIERAAGEGKSRIDSYRSNQKRTDALADLGEVVLDLVRRGEIDPNEIPEAHDALHALEELDGEDYHSHEHGHDHAPPTSRTRFDDRKPDERRPGGNDGTVSSGAVWRPPGPKHAHADDNTALEPPAKPAPPARKGGITFGSDDDDSDLADYMHPDDVPPKPRDGDPE